MKYEVRLYSTVADVYWIDADSAAEAEEIVLGGDRGDGRFRRVDQELLGLDDVVVIELDNEEHED